MKFVLHIQSTGGKYYFPSMEAAIYYWNFLEKKEVKGFITDETGKKIGFFNKKGQFTYQLSLF